MLLPYFFFFFNDTATTEIYTLSLHDALPIFIAPFVLFSATSGQLADCIERASLMRFRSEEHTSELQSRPHLVCRLLLEKKTVLEVHEPQAGRALDGARVE